MRAVGRACTTASLALLLAAQTLPASPPDLTIRAVSRADPSLPDVTAAGLSYPWTAPVSADGRFVVFTSSAPNVIPGIEIPNFEVFLLDEESGQASLLTPSAADPTRGAFGQSGTAIISADASHVAFTSDAPDLIPGYSGQGQQLYLFDRASSALQLITHSYANSTVGANGYSSLIQLSTDGRFVLFWSAADDLIPGGQVTLLQVYLYDAALNSVSLVSHVPGNVLQGGNSLTNVAASSADAEWIVFTSDATDLVPSYSGSGDQAYLYRRSTAQVTLVSRDLSDPSIGADSPCFQVAISADGSRLAFVSGATNLVAADMRGTGQIFDYDVASGSIQILTTSATVPDAGGDGYSMRPVLSATGRYVAFETFATDLLVDPLPGFFKQVLTFDRVSATRSLVSHAIGGPSEPGNSVSSDAAMDASGTSVVFRSVATNLVPGFSSGPWSQLYSWSRVDGQIRLLSPKAGEPNVGSNENASAGAISENGAAVVFWSKATDLVVGDWNHEEDVFRAATDGSALDVVSRRHPLALSGQTAVLGGALLRQGLTALSDSGRFVLFTSSSANLSPELDEESARRHIYVYDSLSDFVHVIPSLESGIEVFQYSTVGSLSSQGEAVPFIGVGPSDPAPFQVYVWDRLAGETKLVSHRYDDSTVGSNDHCWTPLVSRSSLFVAYSSVASDLIPQYSGSGNQIYLFDRQTGANRLVSHAAGTTAEGGNGSSYPSGISYNGRWVLFSSSATNLLPGDPGDGPALFLYDGADGTIRRVSGSAGSSESPEGYGSSSVLSRDGRYVAYAHTGSQIYLWDRVLDSTRLVSHSAADPSTSSNGGNHEPVISGDGSHVAWTSFATDLVAGYQGSGSTPQVYLWSAASNASTLVSHVDGAPTQGSAYGARRPTLSAAGTRVAFVSDSPDLIPGSFEYRLDTYLFDLPSLTVVRASQPTRDGSNINQNWEIYPQVSADGKSVAFESDSRYLVDRDWNWTLDLFLASESPGDPIFADGFETGDTSRWSGTTGGRPGNGNEPAPAP